MGDDDIDGLTQLLTHVVKSPAFGSTLVNQLARTQQSRASATSHKSPQATGRSLMKSGRGVVLQSEDLDDDSAFLRTNGRLVEILVNGETWKTLSASPGSAAEFVKDMTRDGKAMGMQLLVADAGYYGKAVRTRASKEGVDVPPVKDKIDALGDSLNSLIIQAASLNTNATSGQMEIFSIRYAEAAEAYADLERRMAELKDLLGLAATAVVEAA